MSAGIYIHIPFCKSRCSYCDFATDIYRDSDSVERYSDALIQEISCSGFRGSSVDTIYFGGGTPSLLSASQVRKITERIREEFDVSPAAEFTLEMNPATVTPEKLGEYRDIGVTRASFGVQTFDDRSLKILARGHDANDARNTFKMLRAAGYENVSFDLIAGLPHQTLEDWSRNLDEAVALNPEHLSLYILEVHEGTPLAEQIGSGRQPAPDEDLAGEMYRLMQSRLDAAGYTQYEISNFSKPGFESKHNNKYWRMAPVFGFGVSAHSFDGEKRRWSNERDTNKYVELIESGVTAVVDIEELTPNQLRREFGFLSLRLREGLDRAEFRRRFDSDVLEIYPAELQQMLEIGLVEISEQRIALTKKGMLFSNEVFEIFV